MVKSGVGDGFAVMRKFTMTPLQTNFLFKWQIVYVCYIKRNLISEKNEMWYNLALSTDTASQVANQLIIADQVTILNYAGG